MDDRPPANPAAPLTAAQKLLWAGQQLHPHAPLYNQAMCFVIDGVLDPETFGRAWQAVVDGSDALRTVVVERRAQPHAAVRDVVDGGLWHEDLRSEPDPESAALARAQAACRRLFDLSERLFDTALIRLADDRWMWYLNQHHVITDAWSTGLVYRRMADCYHRAEAGRPAGAPWPSFAGQAGREAALRSSPGFEEAAQYWDGRFGEHREPAAFYGQTAVSTRSVRVAVPLGSERLTGLRSLLAAPGVATVTPDLTNFCVFATLLAGFTSRVTGNRQPTIGAVAHNRATAISKETVGAFLEVLPMRVELDEGETFLSLLDKTKQEAMTFLRHALPGLDRAGFHRQANATLNYLNVTFPDFAGRPARTKWLHTGHADPEHVVRMHVHDFDDTGQPSIELDLSEDVFDDQLRTRALGHFLRFVDGVLEQPIGMLEAVDILSDRERTELLVDWNRSLSIPPSDETILTRFDAQVARVPERTAVAVAGGDDALTYAQLDERANWLARELVRRGAGPDAPVAICMPPSTGSIVAALAALKAGAAFVAVDHKNPVSRIERMLRDSSAAVVVVDREAGVDAGSVAAAHDWRDAGAHAPGQPGPVSPPPALDGTAYVYFTSGSTGAPKGVRLGSGGLLNLLDAFEVMAPLPDGMLATWWTSIGFDVSAYEIFGALLYGHTLHVIPDAMRADTDAYLGYLARASVHSPYVPPFMLQSLAEAVEGDPGAFSLRRVLVGVEPIPERLLVRIRRQQPHLNLINGYGPTEATTCATLYPVGTADVPDRITPIGRPVPNNRVYVLNGCGMPQPAGVPGEIHIGGAGLALGYLDPADEKGRFVPDHLSGDGRLYRTGDQARMLPDGNLTFLGRIDHQVKVRGFRIEPAEVEFALNRQPDIANAVVVAVDQARGARLVAYVVPGAGSTLDAEDLHWQLRADLPPYMVPSEFVVMPGGLPMTPNGKIDRAALPPPAADAPARRRTGQSREPTTAAERALAHIWSGTFDGDGVGIDDNFFDLGGDSIDAIQIVARARDAGWDVSPQQVFEFPTVAELAARIRRRPPEAPANPPAPRHLAFTPAQLWLLRQNQPAPELWSQVLTVAVPPGVGPAEVTSGLAAWTAGHDALRQAFQRNDDGAWSTRIVDSVEAPKLRVEDVTGLDSAARERLVASLTAELAGSMDLRAPPLLRAAYLIDSDGDDTLLAVAHHLIVDAVSWSVLLDELAAGPADAAPGVGAWTQAVTRYAAVPDARLADAWRAIAGREITAVQRDGPPDGPGTFATEATVEVHLSAGRTAELAGPAPRSGRVTIHELLIVALAGTLAEWTGSPSVRVFVEGHGREAIDGTDPFRAVGWLTSLYPVVVEVPEPSEAALAVSSIKDQLRTGPAPAFSYGAYCYVGDSEELRLDEHDHVVFNYFGRERAARGGYRPVRPIGQVRGPRNRRPFLLEVAARFVGDRLRLEWSYDTESHRETTIRHRAARMIHHLEQAIAACLEDGGAVVGASDFPLAGLDTQQLGDLAAALERPPRRAAPPGAR